MSKNLIFVFELWFSIYSTVFICLHGHTLSIFESVVLVVFKIFFILKHIKKKFKKNYFKHQNDIKILKKILI